MDKKKLTTLLTILSLLGGGLFLFRFLGDDAQGGIAGMDANHDGVRDDLEKLIDEKWGSDPKVRSAARQLAKTFQAEIENPATADSKRGLFAVTCLVHVTPEKSGEILKAIQSAAANTSERAKALVRYNRRFNGTILPQSESILEACSFDPALAQ